ncbi:zinc ribbon domain-containing protein [Chloroflexota bacterium]
MSVIKKLYQLQEVDLELESNEQSQNQIAAQLGESEAVIRVRIKLTREHQFLEESNREQHSIEWEIDDLTSKLVPSEEELYSGRIHNPKELANAQHEIDLLKARRGQLEDKVLEIMGRVELTTQNIATIESELKILEVEWQGQQKQLSASLEQLKTILSSLQEKRQLLIVEFDRQTIEVYQELKKHKGVAVAKVEQGICRGCSISLPITELQQARSGSLVRCSSCGRILFLA